MGFYTKEFCKLIVGESVYRLNDAVTTLDKYLMRKKRDSVFHEDYDIKGSVYAEDINKTVEEAKILVAKEMESLEMLHFAGDKK